MLFLLLFFLYSHLSYERNFIRIIRELFAFLCQLPNITYTQRTRPHHAPRLVSLDLLGAIFVLYYFFYNFFLLFITAATNWNGPKCDSLFLSLNLNLNLKFMCDFCALISFFYFFFFGGGTGLETVWGLLRAGNSRKRHGTTRHGRTRRAPDRNCCLPLNARCFSDKLFRQDWKDAARSITVCFNFNFNPACRAHAAEKGAKIPFMNEATAEGEGERQLGQGGKESDVGATSWRKVSPGKFKNAKRERSVTKRKQV